MGREALKIFGLRLKAQICREIAPDIADGVKAALLGRADRADAEAAALEAADKG